MCVVFFCSSLILCFPGMLLRYCLSDFEMVPVAHIITGIILAFTFHMCWIYFKIFSAYFLITFLSPGTATFINMHVHFFIMTDYDVRLIVRNSSVGPHMLVPYYGNLTFMTCFADFGTWSYQCLLSNIIPISLHLFKCSGAHTLSCLFMCYSFANIGHGDMTCFTV
jgi:hypothetical protein